MSDTPLTTALIADMPADDRPREKALRHGVKSLTDAELMAIIFSTGVKGLSVLDLARKILADANGHLSDVARMTPAAFAKRYKGIGPAKAITLMAALELGTRAGADAAAKTITRIDNAKTAYEYMKHHFDGLDHEQMWILMLNNALHVIGETCVGVGGTKGVVVDTKIIMRHLLDNMASAVMLFHNHPSGQLTPSRPDRDITDRIFHAAELFEIRMLDHVIISPRGYYSFSDEGLIPSK